MRVLLPAVSILLVLASCNRATLPVAGAVVAASGMVLVSSTSGAPAMSDVGHDSHSFQLNNNDMDVSDTAGVALIATGAVMLLAGVVMSGVDHQRDEERAARQAEHAELEEWRQRMNAAR